MPTAEVVTAVESDVALASRRCGSPTRRRPRGAAASTASSTPSACSRPAAVQAARRAAPARSTSSSAAASGRARPSASASTASPRARRRPARRRARLPGPRPPDGRLAAARRRKARARARLPGLSRARCTATRARRRSGSTASGASSASTTRVVGGVLARRWGLPKSIASTIERHHGDDTDGDAALVRLADMLAHYGHGDAVSPSDMLRVRAHRSASAPASCARCCTPCRSRPASASASAARRVPAVGSRASRCCGARRGQGLQADRHELTLSTSTVRTHLHNVYGKLGAVDRAQAVLIATERGWI